MEERELLPAVRDLISYKRIEVSYRNSLTSKPLFPAARGVASIEHFLRREEGGPTPIASARVKE
jgi:hypothetical protein